MLITLLLHPGVRAEAPQTPTLAAELRARGSLEIAGARVSDHPVLQTLLALREAPPAWSSTAGAELLQAALGSAGHGLNPSDYHVAALQAVAERRTSEPGSGIDLLRTATFVRLAMDLSRGRLEPADFVQGIDLDRKELDQAEILALREALARGDVGAFLAGLAPQAPLYRELRRALAEHRTIAARGGWPQVPDGPTLHPGERSPRVPALRERLRASNDLRNAAETEEPELFDSSLTTATRHFQERHLLNADGVVGQRTLAELRVPIAARIDQIRVNLERARWLLRDLPPSYVLVDVAGFEVRVVTDGVEALRSRVVVGKPFRKTPIFRSAITYLEFSPTWTVPPTILRNDILPAIRKDRAYLAKRHMRVLQFDGREVDPAGIDWAMYTGRRSFPYLIRQDPGADNALGQVKFMFPNEHHVYLHDTPARDLFAQTERAFSSGCIRVEQAGALARLLLGREGWSAEQVDAALASGTTRKVALRTRVPVLLYYWTVKLEDDGDVAFKRDIYGRDAALLAALDRS